ncbi:MAG: hypothetical protein V3U88_06000 [Methylococcales bacterium]
MNKFNLKQLTLAGNQSALLSVTMSRILIAAAFIFSYGEIHAQTIFQPISPTIYISKFSCGFQGRLSLNSPTALEPGRYQTSFAMFNPNRNPLGNVSVFASISGQPAVPVKSLSLPAFGSGLVNCADIFSAFGVNGTPNAVVGFIYVRRSQSDLDVQTTYSRSVPEGASIDVERVEPRKMDFSRSQSVPGGASIDVERAEPPKMDFPRQILLRENQ